MVDINIVYEGQLRCLATHGPSGQTVKTDAPVDNHGRGEYFSPTDLIGAALGSCILTILGILAERHHLDLAGATVKVEKHMLTSPVRRIGRLPVEVRIPTPLSPEMREILERAAHTCPVHRSLHPDIDAPITFIWGR